ncbi:uncharacterized protein LOC119356814 [Triticum dicoccoides]|uniref:uncharacterized protein LOC119356814 n=1 Tax=Triticum dicoccoides TaxID=85692 RepID=UPI00188F0200|nr:uncharacterized protein LOC119356814 [Triticum dicoccoides]
MARRGKGDGVWDAARAAWPRGSARPRLLVVSAVTWALVLLAFHLWSCDAWLLDATMAVFFGSRGQQSRVSCQGHFLVRGCCSSDVEKEWSRRKRGRRSSATSMPVHCFLFVCSRREE